MEAVPKRVEKALFFGVNCVLVRIKAMFTAIEQPVVRLSSCQRSDTSTLRQHLRLRAAAIAMLPFNNRQST